MVAGFASLAFLSCWTGSGQTLDTAILGVILDPTGSVVAGASVTISQPATGFTRVVTASQEGKYEVRYLLPGEYTVEVKASGFRAERQTGIVLQLAQQARIDFHLEVGDVVETVEVTSAAPLLQTENATLGEVVAPERIVNLPLNGRMFADLANLTPGVSVTNVDWAPASYIVANGTRFIWMQVNFDGVTAVNNRHAFAAMYPSVDALQEFKVQSGNYSAEYGGNAGVNINVQLKSGTNSLHGTLFEYLRNNDVDARNYFIPSPLPKDILRRNQFGGVLSGPIRKDRTFFTVGYEGKRATKESGSSNIVPTPAMRRGDFSALSTPIIDPLGGGSPFPGNVIPSSRLDPVSVNLINTYEPLPNRPGPLNFAGVNRDDNNQDQALVRIDHRFSDRDQVFGHYIYQFLSFPNFDFNPVFKTDRDFRNQSVAFQHVHTFNPTLLNEFRFGYQRGNRNQLSPLRNTNFTQDDIGIHGMKVNGPNGRPFTQIETGFPVIDISGFVGMGDRNVGGYCLDFSRTFQFVDNLSVIRGNHAMKVGADIRRLLDDASTSNWPFGEINFTDDIANNAMASYMLGFPRTVLTPEGIPVSAVRQWRTSYYFQDDWRVTRNLTLNLGLRYDLLGLPHDNLGNSRTLRFDLDPNGPVLWPAVGTVTGLWINEHNHFAPRFGFAYRIRNTTVVRGGYGIFTGAIHFDNINIMQLNPPVAGSITIINNPLQPVATIQYPMPASLFPQSPYYNITSVQPDRHYRNGYMQNWNLQLAQEISRNDVLEVGYVGSKGTHLDTSVHNFNSPDPGPGDVQPRRPYPQYGPIRMQISDGNSIYNALQTRYEHRFSQGLSLTAAYTWSHWIDDQYQSSNWGGAQAQDPRHRGSNERADSTFDIRHRLVVGYVYELPFARSLKGVAKFLADAWSLGGIVTLQSGSPFNVTQAADAQNTGSGSQRPGLLPGQSPVLPASQRTPDRWFNTAAFTQSVLMYGNSPRNPLVGPGTKVFDLSATKSFKLPFAENHQVMFRAEFFNSFNTPQFDVPSSALGTGSFGNLVSTKIDNREIQFALKYIF
jgi:outer membrane receptor protein involved in Fe transport